LNDNVANLGRESSYRTPVKLVQFLAGNSQFVATVLKTVLGTLPDGFGELVAILVLKHISWGPDHGFSFDDLSFAKRWNTRIISNFT
jgi:hypothetical protein